MMAEMSLRERLAELEHEQWMAWSRAVASLVPAWKYALWVAHWKPYSELNKEAKDHDREWADKVLRLVAEWVERMPEILSVKGEGAITRNYLKGRRTERANIVALLKEGSKDGR